MTRDNFIISDEEQKVLQEASYLSLCPLDGRYVNIAKQLAPYFSEFALVKNRVKVEVAWLVFVIQYLDDPNGFLKKFSDDESLHFISQIYDTFDKKSFDRVKEIEGKTNHDVKAVEYFIDEKLDEVNMSELKSFVHIGCTSEDINNTSYANMIFNALYDVWIPTAEELIYSLSCMASSYSATPMLAHTHGQPATPTTVGKEMLVASSRLEKCVKHLKDIPILAKFNGATGNYSAISIAFTEENWTYLAEKFVTEYLSLDFNPVTTQIEPHDYIVEIADCIKHFNNILIDLDLDMWLYISMEYFKQTPVKGEVGSSTMPHKVNPIRFENSEANIEISNALLTALSNKLPRSRMQRDLSDSSTMRNVGMAIGYSLQAIEQTIGGLKKASVNKAKLADDLNNRWEVLAEPIQTILRKYGIPDAYEQLKELTRGKSISKEAIHEFINSLDGLSEFDKDLLLNLTPDMYTGYAQKIVFDNLE